MPATEIDYSAAHKVLNSPKTSQPESDYDNLISTPYGLSILEIQGELNLPTSIPTESQLNIDQNKEYISNFAKVDDIYHAVRFGTLDFDAKDFTKVTLYIGKSQRLLGSIVDLDIPLGVMRIPSKYDANGNSIEECDQEKIKIIDIIKKKIIFKNRPLPIM